MSFIRCRVQASLDCEHVRTFQTRTKDKINRSSVVHSGKSKCTVLAELGQELGTLRDQLNKRLQGRTIIVTLTWEVQKIKKLWLYSLTYSHDNREIMSFDFNEGLKKGIFILYAILDISMVSTVSQWIFTSRAVAKTYTVFRCSCSSCFQCFFLPLAFFLVFLSVEGLELYFAKLITISANSSNTSNNIVMDIPKNNETAPPIA